MVLRANARVVVQIVSKKLSVLTAEWWRCVRSYVEGPSGRKVDGFQSQWTAGRN